MSANAVTNRSRWMAGFGIALAASFVASCHHEEAPSAVAKAGTAAVVLPVRPSPPRAKPDFGGLSSAHVEVSATGRNLEDAVDNALRLAVEQVNGKVIQGRSERLMTGLQSDLDGQRSDLRSAAFAQWLATRTDGVITNFRIISQKQLSHVTRSDEERYRSTQGGSRSKGSYDHSIESESAVAAAAAAGDGTGATAVAGNGASSVSASASGDWDQQQGASSVEYQGTRIEFEREWSVTIAADVAKYREALGAKLTRVVVALPRTKQTAYRVGDKSIPATEVAEQIRTALSDALTQTQRFTVLDRDANEEIGREIEWIQSGNVRPADAARIGQQLATDLIVIPTIVRFEYLRHERRLRLSGRSLVSYTGGGALSFRVVNATTGQIVMSQSFRYELPATPPTTLEASVDGHHLASRMMDNLDRKIATAIMQSTYPRSIVQVDGRNVVVNQGGEAVTEGKAYRVVKLGKEIIDPQSGLSLGPLETSCCTIVIDRVAQNLSYGHILEEGVSVSDPFVPGSLELREEARIESVPEVATAPKATRAASHLRPAAAKSNPVKVHAPESDDEDDW